MSKSGWNVSCVSPSPLCAKRFISHQVFNNHAHACQIVTIKLNFKKNNSLTISLTSCCQKYMIRFACSCPQYIFQCIFLYSYIDLPYKCLFCNLKIWRRKKNHRIIRTECGILDNANSYKVWEKYERDRINKGWNSRMIKSAEVNRIYTNGFFDGDLHMSWFRELMLMTTRLKIGTNSWLSSASTTTHNKCARHRPPVGPRSDWNHWCESTLCGWWAFWIIFVIWGRGYFVCFLDA